MKKIVLAVALLTLLLAAGCGGNKAQEEKPLKKVSVILDWTPNTNHTGVYVAQKQGFYEEEGLDVDIVQPSEGGAAQLVASGQGDFGFSYQEEVTIARTRDIPVKALAAVIQHNTSGFASPAGKGIKSPKDFEGKKYGGWGSPAEEAMLKALMNQDQADFNKVEIINIGSADFLTSVSKDIDFAWIFKGWDGIQSELKGVPLNFIYLRDYNAALDFYTPVLIASEDTVKNNPELVAAFMKATARGYDYCIKDPEKAGQVLLDCVPELNRELVMASQQYLSKEYRADAPRWGEMSGERWKKYADWMYSQALIEKPLDYQEAYTNQFLPKE
ncbi:putative thiamine biosynthesis protein [Pelotomaculum sp. FP]|uniref:ABC transporter substrate-binding protein n=1 Tax=Pelotomaculum sp. FP TaxID=261474 RepID=UPI0010654B0A|nr:ABC transporter substrate-binding protein [Pelotomaculum sp. FP]TEB16371.1 putative thiamine biosynthesis protein [Pelotomaculum sp. FP]